MNSEGDSKTCERNPLSNRRVLLLLPIIARNRGPNSIFHRSCRLELYLLTFELRTTHMKITENDVRSALPDLTTTMRLPDLGAAAEVYRDRWGSTE